MKIIRSQHFPPSRFSAIYLLGILVCRRETYLSERLLRHERIHSRQMLEMLVVGFYLWYLLEWLVRLPMKGNAYHNISFEREAYANEAQPDYLTHRPLFAWRHYLRKQPIHKRKDDRKLPA